MKNFFYVLLFAFLLLFSVKSWREKAIALVMNKKTKGITLEQLNKAQGIISYSSENLKVNIYNITAFSPKTPDFKMKDDNMHYVMLETSIENLSDKTIDAGFSHCYLEDLTGYYQENNLQKTADSENYYGKELPAKTSFAKKYFFFPMAKNAKPLKIHFDDPLAKTQHTFSLKL